MVRILANGDIDDGFTPRSPRVRSSADRAAQVRLLLFFFFKLKNLNE